MSFVQVEHEGARIVEGPSGRGWVTQAKDATLVLEACASAETDLVLLYAENLPAGFFDLSSRQAGEILQRLRNYCVRLAVVCVPGSPRFSTRFGEMLAEEQRGRFFALFADRDSALNWLAPPAAPGTATPRAP